MANEQAKITYLEEHISYELVMLNYTFMRLLTLQPSAPEGQLDFNAYLESFGVHARNLVGFLSGKSFSDDRNASDYVPGFEAPGQARLQQVLIRLEQQILHVTALRATDAQEKFTVDDARELYAWIVPAILRFQGQLGPRYRASLNVHGAAEALVATPMRRAEPAKITIAAKGRRLRWCASRCGIQRGSDGVGQQRRRTCSADC